MDYLNINPWTLMWSHPKMTMRAILDWNPRRIILWLAILCSMMGSLIWLGFSWIKYPEKKILLEGWYITGVLIAGGILGLVHLYFGGWLYNLTSRWIGGKGSFTSSKCAVGWSNYPYIVANIFGLLSLGFIGNYWISTIFGFIGFVLDIWAFIIFVNLLGEAQRFSAWRGLLAVIIAVLMIFILIMAVLILIPMVAPLFSIHAPFPFLNDFLI